MHQKYFMVHNTKKKNIRFYASLVHYVQNYYSIFGKINDNT